MKIAVIDSGIDKSFLCKGTLFLDMIVGKEGRLCERTVEPLLTEHGTICAQIIEKYTDETPQFYSLCVFDNEEMKTSCDTLISALRWCYDNKIPLIHMSIGSRCAADFEKIRLETQKLIAAGQIIVAAVSNAGQYTVPAQLSGVIGVIADEHLSGFQWAVRESPYMFASSCHRLCGREETQISNSYAAPTVTAAVFNLLLKKEILWTVPKIWFALSEEKYTYRPINPDFAGEDNVIYNLSEAELINTVKTLDRILPPHKGIVCCKRLPTVCGGLRKHRLIWDEGCIPPTKNVEAPPEDEACPVVFVTGINALKTAEKMIHNLTKDGYSCIGISNIPYAYLHHMEYVFGDNIRLKINEVQNRYLTDIIVCCGNIPNTDISKEDYIVNADIGQTDEKQLIKDIINYFS